MAKIPNTEDYCGKSLYLKKGGQGGALEPPFSKIHEYHISDLKCQECSMSLNYFFENKDISEEAKSFVREKIGVEIIPPIETVMDWVNQVEKYFHGCYSKDGIDRNASNCIFFKEGMPIENSLAVMFIRKYYPNYKGTITNSINLI